MRETGAMADADSESGTTGARGEPGGPGAVAAGTGAGPVSRWPRWLPGTALAACGAAIALAVGSLWGVLSPLPVAVVLGVLVGNTVTLPAATRPGLSVAAKRLLRLGVVLLGLRLALADVVALGWTAAAAVAALVALAFASTLLIGRALRVGRGVALLTGTGFAICGASAIAAAQGVVDADEEEVASAVGLVILFGSLSIVLLPLWAAALGLAPATAGSWIGAAVHDVGQTVAAAGTVGEAALERAVVVKLGRVLLLGPLLVGLTLAVRGRVSAPGERRGALVPLFVVGFLGAVALRSTGVLPAGVLAAAATAQQALFGAALFALGVDVRLRRLRGLGPRPLLLGTLVYLLVAGLALLAALLVPGLAG